MYCTIYCKQFLILIRNAVLYVSVNVTMMAQQKLLLNSCFDKPMWNHLLEAHAHTYALFTALGPSNFLIRPAVSTVYLKLLPNDMHAQRYIAALRGMAWHTSSTWLAVHRYTN